MSNEAKVLSRGYHALSMLVMHARGHFTLREDKFDEYMDTVVAVLEIANNEKHRLRPMPAESQE